ncbi:MAG: IS110 family transposase [Streptosporangiaceae bacterium]|nr:IS110 family transposase [Streptosporangiaceae bacterium]
MASANLTHRQLDNIYCPIGENLQYYFKGAPRAPRASARKLAPWAGLTPTVRGSDRVVRHGHISKQGSVWVRWVLCEAAQTAKRHPQFAASYQVIARRRGKKIATTAIARKLLTRAYHLLTDAASGGAPH